MAKTTVHAGICGFVTAIETVSEDKQNVHITFESDCPHVVKAKEELKTVNAYEELFKKPHETQIYKVLSPHLPHVTCPLYSGFLKAVEVAAGLALPKDVQIQIER